MRVLLPTILLTGAVSSHATLPAQAAELEIAIEIPRLDVAEYHRPYLAVWLENADRSTLANLALWYDGKMKNREGETWLKDLRQWWRRSGRALELPLDGVSGPTRPVGLHKLGFDSAAPQFANLKPGEYRVIVEAAREVGGREMLEIPLQWPPREGTSARAEGKRELGVVSIEAKP